MKRRGITVVELLVLIGIVILLIILLLPAIQSARHSAKIISFDQKFNLVHKVFEKNCKISVRVVYDAKIQSEYQQQVDKKMFFFAKLISKEDFNEAKELAEYFGFEVRENPEDYLNDEKLQEHYFQEVIQIK